MSLTFLHKSYASSRVPSSAHTTTHISYIAHAEVEGGKPLDQPYALDKIITTATKMPAPNAKRLYLFCSVSV